MYLRQWLLRPEKTNKMSSSTHTSKKMHWNKLGLVFAAANHYDWMVSHATNPVAERINNSDKYRVYFSCRNKEQKSSIGFVVFDIRKPLEILEISSSPVVSPGEAGYFDDAGCTMGSIVQTDEATYLYYLGWNLSVSVPWRNSIGLAVRRRGEQDFQKHPHCPILDRNHIDPLTLSYPWVIKDEKKWHMWYGSHLSWGKNKDELIHVLKYADSTDGITWNRHNRALLAPELPDSNAYSRPCVIATESSYRMWYSVRGLEYRVGYAESADGINWVEHQEPGGLTVSAEGWDSKSVEYATVFQHEGQTFMLYNGNGYGASGFGIAVLET